jgi:hypothetical protein
MKYLVRPAVGLLAYSFGIVPVGRAWNIEKAATWRAAKEWGVLTRIWRAFTKISSVESGSRPLDIMGRAQGFH